MKILLQASFPPDEVLDEYVEERCVFECVEYDGSNLLDWAVVLSSWTFKCDDNFVDAFSTFWTMLSCSVWTS